MGPDEKELGGTKMSSGLARKNEEEVSSASRAATKMTDKQLVTRVKTGFKKIKAELPYILELKNRFAALPRGSANIAGCKTWKTFCIEHLHRTPRAVAYALAEEHESIQNFPVQGSKPETKQNVAVRAVVDRSPVEPVQIMTPVLRGEHFTPDETDTADPPEKPATDPAALEAEDRNRRALRAYYWLSGFLRQFEGRCIALAEPGEVVGRLTSAEVALLGSCCDWIEAIFVCAK
jgi:hypothetical protein